MKMFNVLYYASTSLLAAMMCMSAGMYVFKHADIVQAFTALGFPTYIIYPLAAAKLLGLVAIWSNLVPKLASLAYAGFLYNFVLAAVAHLMAGDGQADGAMIALVLLAGSYVGRLKRSEASVRDGLAGDSLSGVAA